jgi:TRAP-type uncharacterized transport system substrate-binding protein
VPLPETWANPNTTRSSVVLQIAAELVAMPGGRLRQAKALLREDSGEEWALSLFGSATAEGIHAVARRETALAIVNPSTALKMAYLGTGPFKSPLPLRTIAVIPTEDQLVFAVKRDTGLVTFEDIARRRYPLKVNTRGTRGHSLHFMLDSVAVAGGFSFDDIRAWGGELEREGSFPHATTPKGQALARGEYEAFFEEGTDEWLDIALDAGMTALPLAEETVQKLEAQGFRRAVIRKERYPRLGADVLTVSFSGWPIFVHAELPDGVVRDICAALDARKHLIPWQGTGPLPVERMCRDSEETPVDVPLHPAAERFWRELGYLDS